MENKFKEAKLRVNGQIIKCLVEMLYQKDIKCEATIAGYTIEKNIQSPIDVFESVWTSLLDEKFTIIITCNNNNKEYIFLFKGFQKQYK